MNTGLNSTEVDFIEFMAAREGLLTSEFEKKYRSVRDRFDIFRNKRFRQLSSDMHAVVSLFNNKNTEENILEIYSFLAILHILLFISQSYPKRLSKRFRHALVLFKGRQFKKIIEYTKRYFKRAVIKKDTASLLIEQVTGPIRVVDYGCGMAYTSAAIARKNKDAKIYLVDIDTVLFDFTIFRFKKYDYNFEVIKITKDNLYPALPEHNLCLANEVMEHVFEPLKIYENIKNCMDKGGLLYGNFADHSKGMFHVSPDLSALRKKISEDYETVETKIYRKK